ncbi:MAG: nickel pincer cofactor biosynthesis protein LarB [Gemmatimonadetes bacterium]|nr:nickel pincer cofactor biosynthesis protein LarB [Gemmatimonadota bacterium]
MNAANLSALLAEVASGSITTSDAVARLRSFEVDDLEFARVDHLRPLTQGHQEVVFCQGKTLDQVLGICESLAERGGGFLTTRADEDIRKGLRQRFPTAHVNELGRTVHLEPKKGGGVEITGNGTILITCAGTADLPVVEEARVVARAFGNKVETLNDVGVAGIHRLLTEKEVLSRANVVIVVAGMDGALASVVGGMVAVPVIAVPTSTGYGASLGGLSALLAMLNSCASGVTVVNIDNGFGAAAAASRINHL